MTASQPTGPTVEPTRTGGAAGASARRRRRGRANPVLATGLVMLAVVLAVCLLSLVWTPMNPLATSPLERLEGGSAQHLLGTDSLGRDVLSQLIVGSRLPLLVGVSATTIAAVLGVPWGVVSGMTGSRAGQWLMRWNDIVQAFPPLLIAIILAAVWGASTWTAVVALGVGYAPGFARVARSATMQVMGREYAMAARASGRGPLFTALRHVLPNIASIVIVQSTVTLALAVLSEAALSYLGLGTPAPTPSWGRMLQEGQSYVYNQPTLILWPAIAIAWTVLAFNLLGDGLRDQLDPRTTGAAS